MLAILISSRMTFAEPAANDPPPEPKSSEAKAAAALVSRNLVQPLAAKDGKTSRFSRARLPPQERRVRLLDEQPGKDALGSAFMHFAIDVRHGIRADNDESHWRLADITGCVYVDSSQVFVKKGDEYRPAAFLLGKNLKAAAATTCQPAPAQLAHSN
jgi:zona occludens toxin (predicted ATPase)